MMRQAVLQSGPFRCNSRMLVILIQFSLIVRIHPSLKKDTFELISPNRPFTIPKKEKNFFSISKASHFGRLLKAVPMQSLFLKEYILVQFTPNSTSVHLRKTMPLGLVQESLSQSTFTKILR